VYKISNHLVDTHFHIPNLRNLSGTPDIITEPFNNSRKFLQKYSNNFYKVNLKKVEIFLKDIAYIVILNGGKLVKIEELCDLSHNKIFLTKFINHVIPYCIYQKKEFALHASGFVKDDEGIIFMGLPESGKSSLACSFSHDHFLAEDSILVKRSQKKIYAFPSHPFMKLSKDICNMLSYPVKDEDLITGDKRNRFLVKNKNFYNKKVPLKKCYFLEWGDNFSIEKISLKKSVSYLLTSSFGAFPYNSCIESNAIQFDHIKDFVNLVPFFKIIRQKNRLFKDNNKILDHIKYG